VVQYRKMKGRLSIFNDARGIVPRTVLAGRMMHCIRNSPVTALLGPRQCGKTTLARRVAFGAKAAYFDMEVPSDLKALDQPLTALERLKGLVVLDEIQRKPELYAILRVLADRRPLPARFLILGSASPSLIRRTSESLAGRVRFIEMGGFTVAELGKRHAERAWLRGGLPRSYLASADRESLDWRESFIATFLERDIPQLEIRIPAVTLRRFWTMVAHYHGQVWNASAIGSSLGMSHVTARHHLDILTGAYMVRQLQPWFLNAGKRLVKSPKVYIRDSGILHALLNIGSFRDLESHPKLGASWEGFMMEEILRVVGERDAYFWATYSGSELDLLLVRKGKRWGFEFKYGDAPVMTKSLHSALEELKPERVWVVYPGRREYALGPRVAVISPDGLPKALKQLHS